MLHRLLFVAGMTVGVMTPLVWSAYVARPASHAQPAPTVKIATAAPQAQRPAPAATQDITGAITSTPMPAPDANLAPRTTAHVMIPPPRQEAPPANAARAAAKPAPSRLAAVRLARPHAQRRNADRYLPAVVDHYDGAHIIIVCAALTLNEQLRAGCP